MRSLLQAHLKEALRAERGQIRFGRRCEGVTLTPDGAHVRFVGGAEVHADIVIGCDGLRSQVRESLALSQPLQEYRKAYLRGVAEIELEADTLRMTWCPDGRLFGTAPLPEDAPISTVQHRWEPGSRCAGTASPWTPGFRGGGGSTRALNGC